MARRTLDKRDVQPLVGERNNNRGDHCSFFRMRSCILYNWQWTCIILVTITLVAVGVFNKTDSSLVGKDVQAKRPSCPAECSSVVEKLHRIKWGGSLLETSTMLRRAQEERAKLVHRLVENYGQEFFDLLFLDPTGESMGRTGFSGANETNDVSRRRFVRKIMKKILQVQVSVQKELENQNCMCEQPPGATRYLQGSSNNSKVTQLPDSYAKMVFVNGGHSSAAGHGNIFNETYTAVMEQAARDVFGAVGIELVGRNRAMGGMASSPELALCMEALYGVDADVITWNFGMTDGHDFWRHSLYANRRGVHWNRPLLLDLDIGDGYAKRERVKVLKEVEEAGLATMYMDVNYFSEQNAKEYFPDMQNKTQKEIDAVPEYVRYMRCGESVEKGDPFCEEMKYSNDCTPHKAPWHPGWKAHALNGNLLGLFMVDLLIDALKALDLSADPSYIDGMLSKLQRDEDADYERFFKSSVPDKEFVAKFWNENITQDYAPLFRRPVMCHTALLPAQTRYKGFLTEMENSSFEHHDIGIQRNEMKKLNETAKSTMQLVYEEKYEEHYKCPFQVAIDYRDFFMVTHQSGKSSLTVPNKAEKEAYIAQGHKFQGIVLVCFVKCPWGQCPPGDMREGDVESGNVTLSVNGNRVTDMKDINGCFLLEGEQGYIWNPNSKGEFKFVAQVHPADGMMRVSSIVLI